MDIFYLACPICSKTYYADVSLLSLDVELHCPFCGAYFRHGDAKEILTGDQKLANIVQLSKDKKFYKPEKGLG
jgi:hypothetical protein